MNVLSMIPLICSIMVFILGLNVYVSDSRSRLNRIYLIYMILLSLEMLVLFGYLHSTTIGQAEFWWRVDLFWPFLTPALFLFILAYLEHPWMKKRVHLLLLSILYSMGFFVIELTTDWLSGPPQKHLDGYFYGPGGSMVASIANTLLVHILIIIILVLLVRNFIRTKDGRRRMSSMLILIGVVIPCLVGLIFEDILPFLDIDLPLIYFLALAVGSIFIWRGLRIRDHYEINKTKAAAEIMDSIPDGVFITNRQGEIITQNKGGRELLGHSDVDIVDMKLVDLFPKGGSVYLDIRSRTGGNWLVEWNPENLEVQAITRYGQMVAVSITKVSVRDRKGRVQGYALIMKDQTFKKFFEKEVETRRTTLENDLRRRAVELEETNVKLNQTIRELRITRNDSDAEKKKAELYLDIMTHDISNLHQGVQAWLTMAQTSKNDTDRIQGFIIKAKESVDRSIWLVRNIVLISDIRRKAPKLEPVDVMPMLWDSIEHVRSQFNKDDVEINVHTPYSIILVEADQNLSEVFYHIIHNGVKFSKNGSPRLDIGIQVESGGRDVSISFFDHGRGIPDNMKKEVFNRLESKGRYTHTGLGLALVKTLMARYKGVVWITDRVYGDHGKGAVFHLRFRLLEYG